MTDATTARALNHGSRSVHIYSNSWGPPDNGYLVSGPGRVTSMAIQAGARTVIN